MSARSVIGDDVGTFRDDGDGAIAMLGDTCGNSLVHRVDHVYGGQLAVFIAKACRVELNPAHPHGFQLHLGLPLVDIGERLSRESREKSFWSKLDKLLLCFAECL